VPDERITAQLRIIADSQEQAELVRQVLEALAGGELQISLTKPRSGRRDGWLSYGTLTILPPDRSNPHA
jgi:hypothetical protein